MGMPRYQPQRGPVRLSALAQSLGFTHVFNFGLGGPGATNVVTGKPGISLASGAVMMGGPGGKAVQFGGALGNRLEVAGNPFATSTCTYLWLDSGVDSTSNGQAVTSSRYGNTNLLEQFGLQVRVAGSAITILSAQYAAKFQANSARDNTGKLNAMAVSVAGDNDRHAVFGGGRLIAAGQPTTGQPYNHGLSAIGGAYDVTSSTVKYYALLFAPRVIPDDALKYLTANPWAMFADAGEEDEFAAVAPANTYSLNAAPGQLVLSGGAARVVVARRLAVTTGAFSLNTVTAGLAVGRRLAAAAGAFGVSGQAASLRTTRKMPTAAGAFVLSLASAQLIYTPKQGPVGPYTLGAARGSLALAGTATTFRVQRRLSAVSGMFSLAGSAAALKYTGTAAAFDISKIHPSRIVVFEGSGSRVTPFEGSGSRVTRFE